MTCFDPGGAGLLGDRLSKSFHFPRRCLPRVIAQADGGGAAGAPCQVAEGGTMAAGRPSGFLSKLLGPWHTAITLTKTTRLCVDRCSFTRVVNGCYGNPPRVHWCGRVWEGGQTDRTLTVGRNADRESCDLVPSVSTGLRIWRNFARLSMNVRARTFPVSANLQLQVSRRCRNLVGT